VLTSWMGDASLSEVIDELKSRSPDEGSFECTLVALIGELALLRARQEALAVLAEGMRAEADPGEVAALAGIDACLTCVLDEEGQLRLPEVTP
jgi:hypothetical protein